ncbi:unnamed protein product [Dibothriocephalus latus]|uniref:Helix-turn-helix domain-containing protein n=1 Tax=Dibothriocephalus latus TaxID=60516 RepID=A0A3P7LYG0_DIBLA|nr:unnamed protein product [Dibothriocephalus latus]
MHAEVKINYERYHPSSHKTDAVNSPLTRARTHCSDNDGYQIELKYLFELFSRNVYQREFVRRCMRQHESRKKVLHSGNQSAKPFTWRSLPYIKNGSEIVDRHLRKHNIRAAHKPMTTSRGQLKEIIYKIPYGMSDDVYCNQTGKLASVRIHKDQLAVKRRDRLFQVAMHTLDAGHKAWDKTRIVGARPFKKSRDFLEAVHSGKLYISRHIELDGVYKSLREKWA